MENEVSKKIAKLREFMAPQVCDNRKMITAGGVPKSQNSYIPFPEIEEQLTLPVVREILSNQEFGLLEIQLFKRDIERAFHIRHHFFAMREVIPQTKLLQLWYECFSEKLSRKQHRVEVDGKRKFLDGNFKDRKVLENHPLTDPLQIDNQAVRHRYCQMQKPGWKFLRYADGKGRIVQSIRGAELLYKAIADHSIPEFCIALDMIGRKVSFSILDKILWGFDPKAAAAVENQTVLLRYLMENDLMPEKKDLPVSELVCYFAAQFPDCVAVPYLKAVEEFFPGTIRAWRDEFGRNLLWYVLYNMMTAWFHPECKLVAYLIEQGCDPGNRNQLGLSWQYVTENLTQVQKQQMLTERYLFRCGKVRFGPALRLAQPMDKMN